MTLLMWRTSATPLRRRNTAAHRWFNARHTCSAVTSGFFPPQPLRVGGDEAEDDQGQGQVSHQPGVVPPLVIHQPGLLLPEAEGIFHRPAPERHGQYPGQR